MVVAKKYWMIGIASIGVTCAEAGEYTVVTEGAKYLCHVVLVRKLNNKIESGLPVPGDRTREKIITLMESTAQNRTNYVSSSLREQKGNPYPANIANDGELGKRVIYTGQSKL